MEELEAIKEELKVIVQKMLALEQVSVESITMTSWPKGVLRYDISLELSE